MASTLSRALFIDIETRPLRDRGGSFSRASKREHQVLSIAWARPGGRAQWSHVERDIYSKDARYALEKEKELLGGFPGRAAVRSKDLLVAWNAKEYDAFVLRSRARRVGLGDIFGRKNFVDLMEVAKETFRKTPGLSPHRPWTLESFASDLAVALGKTPEGKVKLGVEGGDFWKLLTGSQKEFEALKGYALRDVDLLVEIEKHTGILSHHLSGGREPLNLTLLKQMRRYQAAEDAAKYWADDISQGAQILISGDDSKGLSALSNLKKKGVLPGEDSLLWVSYPDEVAGRLRRKGKLGRSPVIGAQVIHEGKTHRWDLRVASDRGRAYEFARKLGGVAEDATSSAALGAAHLSTPAKVVDQTSDVLKDRKAIEALHLRGVAPYAVGVLIGADILSSRTKTGPFWGAVAGGIAAYLTKGANPWLRAGAIGGAYLATRLIAGSLQRSHDSEIPGFGERGEASISRKQLTDFGSGWVRRVFTRALEFLGRASPAPARYVDEASQFAMGALWKTGIGTVLTRLTEETGSAFRIREVARAREMSRELWARDKGIRAWWKERYPRILVGEGQQLEIDRLIQEGTYTDRLPRLVDTRRSVYEGMGVHRKVHPTLAFTREELDAVVRAAESGGAPPRWTARGEIQGLSIGDFGWVDRVDLTVRGSIKDLADLGRGPGGPLGWTSRVDLSVMEGRRAPEVSGLFPYPASNRSLRKSVERAKRVRYLLSHSREGGATLLEAGPHGNIGRAKTLSSHPPGPEPLGTAKTILAIHDKSRERLTRVIPRAVDLPPKQIVKPAILRGVHNKGVHGPTQEAMMRVSSFDPSSVPKATPSKAQATVAPQPVIPAPVGNPSVKPAPSAAVARESAQASWILPVSLFGGGAVLMGAGAALLGAMSGAMDYAHSRTEGMLYRRGHPRTLEGFRNVGVGGERREAFSDFGTGWDAARSLVGALKIAPGRNALRQVLLHPEFKQALEGGRVVKTLSELGERASGAVHLMETTVGGESFQYVRKLYRQQGKSADFVESMIGGEQGGLGVLRDTISPTHYGRGRDVQYKGEQFKSVFMESLGEVETLEDAMRSGKSLTDSQMKALKEGVNTLHRSGYAHTDINATNILLDRQGRMTLIDPMPMRGFGWGWSFEEMSRVQQAQDLMAIERLETAGNKSMLFTDLQRISNAPSIFMSVEFGAGAREAVAPVLEEIIERAGTRSLFAKELADVKAIEWVRSQNIESPEVIKAMREKALLARRTYKTAMRGEIQGRQNLHRRAVQQLAHSQGRGAESYPPSRRHRSM